MSRIDCSHMKSSVQWLPLFYQLCSSLILQLCFFPPLGMWPAPKCFPAPCPHLVPYPWWSHAPWGQPLHSYHLYLQAHASSGPLSEHLPREVRLLGSSLYQGVFRGCMAQASTHHMAPWDRTLSSVSFIPPPSWGTGSCKKPYCCPILQSKISNLMRCYNSNIKINFILFVLLYFIIQVIELRGKDLYHLTNSQQRVIELKSYWGIAVMCRRLSLI